MTLVLVVDDVFAMAEQYAYDLKRVGGYEVVVATGGEQALDILTGEAVDCVILDLEMPGIDGFQVLRKLKERGSDTPVIVYTGTGNFDRCMQAIRLGAYSFIDKAEPMERVVREVENALERRRLETEVKTLRRETGSDSPLLGSSSVMSQLKQQIDEHVNQVLNLLVTVIDNGRQLEVFHTTRPRRHAVILWTTLHGLIQFRKMEKNLLPGDDFYGLYQQAVDGFLRELSNKL